MDKWQRIEEEVIRINEYRSMKRVRCRLPDGTERDFYVNLLGRVVCALVLTSDRQVVLARQYRVGPDAVLDELPGGKVDDGETPEQAIQREVLEETGYRGTPHSILTNAGVAWAEEVRTHFVVTDAVRVQNPTPDDGEQVEVELMSMQAFREHVRSGAFTDVETAYIALDHLGEL